MRLSSFGVAVWALLAARQLLSVEDMLANLRDFLDLPRRGPDKVAQVCKTDLNETWYSVKEMDSEAWHVTW
jgi:hypothetical protein